MNRETELVRDWVRIPKNIIACNAWKAKIETPIMFKDLNTTMSLIGDLKRHVPRGEANA